MTTTTIKLTRSERTGGRVLSLSLKGSALGALLGGYPLIAGVLFGLAVLLDRTAAETDE